MVSMEDLPEILLEAILSYLTLSERYRLLAINRHFWAQKEALEMRLLSLKLYNKQDARFIARLHGPISNRQPPYNNCRMLLCMTHLHTLDLTSFCTDAFLKCMTIQELFPQLTCLKMQRSQGVTDEGLEWLASYHGANNLEEIDISYCSNTTYAGTFPLRDHLPKLKLLRRQPAWLDGKFHTPFNENSDDIEVHTYWPDGTFSFTRADQSNGFVADLEEWEEDLYMGDKLQYCNFTPPQGFPEWARFAYRPGVCLLKLPEETNNNNNNNGDDQPIRTVLVGQRLRGLKPPRIGGLMKHLAPSIPIGQSRSVNEEGGTDNANLLISKMRVFPLDTLLPPKDLVEECRRTCELMRERYRNDFLEQQERGLHELFTWAEG